MIQSEGEKNMHWKDFKVTTPLPILSNLENISSEEVEIIEPNDSDYWFYFIRNNNFSAIRQMLEEGFDINKVNAEGENITYYAVSKFDNTLENLIECSEKKLLLEEARELLNICLLNKADFFKSSLSESSAFGKACTLFNSEECLISIHNSLQDYYKYDLLTVVKLYEKNLIKNMLEDPENNSLGQLCYSDKNINKFKIIYPYLKKSNFFKYVLVDLLKISLNYGASEIYRLLSEIDIEKYNLLNEIHDIQLKRKIWNKI